MRTMKQRKKERKEQEKRENMRKNRLANKIPVKKMRSALWDSGCSYFRGYGWFSPQNMFLGSNARSAFKALI